MNFNLEKYLPYLDGINAPISQKQEMLRTVWGMMESQVDSAFGIHPVQNAAQEQKKLLNEPALDLESVKVTTVPQFNATSANAETYKRKA